MSTDLKDFAALLKEATKKKEQDQRKKIEETAPLLGDLFSLVSKAKTEVKEEIPEEIEPITTDVVKSLADLFDVVKKGKDSKQEVLKKEAPLLTQFENLLNNPSKEQQQEVVSSIEKIEEKKEEIEQKPVTEQTQEEKEYVKLFKKLEKDIQNFRKYLDEIGQRINSIQTQNPFGSSGSGEVRLARLDDVDTTNLANRRVLSYDALSKKFIFVNQSTGGTGGLTYIEIPLSGLSFSLSSLDHGLQEIVSYRIVNQFQVTVEPVVFIDINRNIVIQSNVSLDFHLILLYGY